jgi:putative Mg2+ transporter-C (MgtC) family protein
VFESISAPGGFGDIAMRLTVAAALGAAVGFNRQLHQKPAGLRTHALVALGASLIALIGTMPGPGGLTEGSAHSRVIQGIVAGVGFIGGGVILRREDSAQVQGLTTAATIWMVAAIGIASGVGLWRTALLAVGLALVVLIVGRWMDKVI